MHWQPRGLHGSTESHTCFAQVLLSSAGSRGGSGFPLGGLLGGEGGVLSDPKRAAAVAASGIPHTIVQAGVSVQTLDSCATRRFVKSGKSSLIAYM